MRVLRTEREIMERFQDSDTLALDLETTGLDWKSDKIAVVAVAAEGVEDVGVLHTAHVPMSEEFKRFLRARRWITHNGTVFDNLFLGKLGVRPAGHWDTYIGECVLVISDRKSLKRDLGSTMKRRLGRDFKEDIPHNWSVPALDAAQVSYAASDVAYLFDVRVAQLKAAQEKGMFTALENEQRLTEVSTQITLNGLACDLDELLRLQRRAQTDAQAADARLKNEFGNQFNVRSPKQVKEALTAAGIALANTRKETLLLRPEQQCRDIVKVREWRQRAGMYDGDFIDKYYLNGKLHGIFRQCGTATLRFSSANPNLQQVPRDFRSMIGGQLGRRVVKADWAQLEVWITALKAGDEELMRVLSSDEDFHTQMAQSMYTGEITKDRRRNGKAGTFTWCFAGGVKGVQMMAARSGETISTREAARMLYGLNSRFAQTAKWHQLARQKVAGRRAVTVSLPWGHKRSIGSSGGSLVAQWCNTHVQGTAAIGMKESLFEIKDRGLLSYVGAVVHDEIVLTGVDDKDAKDVGAELVEAMEVGMKSVTGLDIGVDLDIEDRWTP